MQKQNNISHILTQTERKHELHFHVTCHTGVQACRSNTPACWLSNVFVCVQMCMLTCTHTGVCLYLQICHTQLDKLNHGLRKI